MAVDADRKAVQQPAELFFSVLVRGPGREPEGGQEKEWGMAC